MGKIFEAILNEQLHMDRGTEGQNLEQQKLCDKKDIKKLK